MGEGHNAGTPKKPANQRLWSIMMELQDLRNHEDIDRQKERRIKSAVSELDQVRMAVKSEDSE